MNSFPSIFRHFSTQVWHVLIIPVFFLLFAVLYRPMGMNNILDMGRDLYYFNSTIISAILLVSLLIMRLIYYFLRNFLYKNWWTYFMWCLLELIVMSLFTSLYVTLMAHDGSDFFENVRSCVIWLAGILIFPYSVLSRLFINIARSALPSASSEDGGLVRFYDHNHQLKFVVAEHALLYVAAEENYVRIYYIDNEQVKDYQLRASMTGIEPVMAKAGLFRCHRSYYVNPAHIKALRKDQGNSITSELDYSGLSIPVSRKFYDALSELI